MSTRKPLNRRSFLGRITGGGLAGALGVILGSAARAQVETGVTDSDSGSNSDNAGYGRGGHNAVSDNDPTDPAGQGRNVRGRPQGQTTGITDGDPSDPVGNGRGGYTGQSDSDPRDPSGRGRGTQPNTHRGNYTGLTDGDSAPTRDEPGYGRPGTNCTDADSGPNADPGLRGRHCASQPRR